MPDFDDIYRVCAGFYITFFAEVSNFIVCQRNDKDAYQSTQSKVTVGNCEQQTVFTTRSLVRVAWRQARKSHFRYFWRTGKWLVYMLLSMHQAGKTPLVESISGRFILSTMALIICTAVLNLPRKWSHPQLGVLRNKFGS